MAALRQTKGNQSSLSLLCERRELHQTIQAFDSHIFLTVHS